MARKSPRSVLLSEIAESLLGATWAAQLARLTGFEARTVQRIRDNARAGREHPKAQAVADAFAAVLADRLARADALATVRETVKRRSRAKAGAGRRLSAEERTALIADRPDLRHDP